MIKQINVRNTCKRLASNFKTKAFKEITKLPNYEYFVDTINAGKLERVKWQKCQNSKIKEKLDNIFAVYSLYFVNP